MSLPDKFSEDQPLLTGAVQNFNLYDGNRSFNKVAWEDDNGNTISLSEFKGKVVLLKYWAAWCVPCRLEIPKVDRLQARYGGSKFNVVALNIDEGGKPVAERFLRRLKIKHLKLYLDTSNKNASILGFKEMPTAYLFGKDGGLLGKVVGEVDWEAKEAIDLIRHYIDHS